MREILIPASRGSWNSLLIAREVWIARAPQLFRRIGSSHEKPYSPPTRPCTTIWKFRWQVGFELLLRQGFRKPALKQVPRRSQLKHTVDNDVFEQYGCQPRSRVVRHLFYTVGNFPTRSGRGELGWMLADCVELQRWWRKGLQTMGPYRVDSIDMNGSRFSRWFLGDQNRGYGEGYKSNLAVSLQPNCN